MPCINVGWCSHPILSPFAVLYPKTSFLASARQCVIRRGSKQKQKSAAYLTASFPCLILVSKLYRTSRTSSRVMWKCARSITAPLMYPTHSPVPAPNPPTLPPECTNPSTRVWDPGNQSPCRSVNKSWTSYNDDNNKSINVNICNSSRSQYPSICRYLVIILILCCFINPLTLDMNYWEIF